jgi:hypothetical protein
MDIDIKALKKELEAQLQDEKLKRDELNKLVSADKKKKDVDQLKNLDSEIVTSDRLIAKVKGDDILT